MARKFVPLVNLNNHKKFIDYISKRVPKYTLVKVNEMIALANDAKKTNLRLEDSFYSDYDVFFHEPETHNEEQQKIAESIGPKAFNKINNYIDQIPNLRTAFRNALNQERHKDKVKYTQSAKVVMELSVSERHVLTLIRQQCKELDVDLDSKLHELRFQLKNELSDKAN